MTSIRPEGIQAPTPYGLHVQRLVAQAPALTEEQRVRLRTLLRGRRTAQRAA